MRLSDNSRAREALRQCLPEALKSVCPQAAAAAAAAARVAAANVVALSLVSLLRDPELHASLKDDPATKKWLMQLLHAVSESPQQHTPALPPS